jgi:tetratricopeptide (TPR) repeat protein
MLNKININPQTQILIVYIVLTVVTLAVFWQVNHYDFINFDDQVYVIENNHIQSGITLDGFRWAFSTRYTNLWNPLVWLSFMFDYQLHGLNAGGYHVTNVILHVMSALLLFWLFNRMTGAIWRSAFIAAIFALHPLHVESVAWIAERKDVLSAFFWMLTLCLYVYYTEKPVIRRYLPVLLCFACALMSKPMVITLPIVMILLDYWPLDRLQSRKIVTTIPEVIPVCADQGMKKNKFKKEDLKKNISPPRVQKLSEPKIAGIIPIWQLWEKIPFFILSIVMIIITLYNPSTLDMSGTHYLKQFPLLSRLANAPVAFVTYLEKTFWPHDMTVFYPFSEQIPLWQVLGASLLILIITAAVIVMIKRLPYLFAGWMWFSVTITPVIGIIQISRVAPYAMADRYHYLPSIGLGVMLAWGIPALISSEAIRKKVLFPAGIIFLGVISFISWTQCGYWKDSFELFKHALQVTKDNALAHHSFGRSLLIKGKIEEAIDHFNEAIRLTPDDMIPYFNRGAAYAKAGKHQRAIEDYTEVIRLKPDDADAYNNRGLSFGELGKHQRAIEDYTKAILLKPDDANAYYNRGIACGELGQYQSAIEDYNEAIRLKPDNAEAYSNRGVAYDKLGQHQRAIEDYKQATRLNPDSAQTYYNRGITCGELGQYQSAIEDYNEAIRLKPNYVDAYINRGIAYAYLGQHQRAIEDYTEVIRLQPDNAEAYSNRGVAYVNLNQYQSAIGDYNEAIRLKPDNADAYNNRGITYLLQSKEMLACPDAKKACALGNCKALEMAKSKGNCR